MSLLRVVVDTNVLVSGIVYPDSIPGQIFAAWESQLIAVCVSPYILSEVVRVVPRLEQARRQMDRARKAIDDLKRFAESVEPLQISDPTLRDPADHSILGTFLAANADYLITGDKDLLALAATYPILTPAQFWSKHGSCRPLPRREQEALHNFPFPPSTPHASPRYP